MYLYSILMAQYAATSKSASLYHNGDHSKQKKEGKNGMDTKKTFIKSLNLHTKLNRKKKNSHHVILFTPNSTIPNYPSKLFYVVQFTHKIFFIIILFRIYLL